MTEDPLDIIIFGASGKTGRELVQQALGQGYRVTAFVRRRATFTEEDKDLVVVEGDINNIAHVRDAIRGKHAVVSALGVSRTLQHDPEVVRGIRTMTEAMAAENVERIIYLSVFLANARPGQFSFFVHNVLNRIIRKEVLDHEAKEKIIETSGSAFTIVRATRLKQAKGSGKFRHGETLTMKNFLPSVHTTDVAHFMLQQIRDNKYIRHTVFITGN